MVVFIVFPVKKNRPKISAGAILLLFRILSVASNYIFWGNELIYYAFGVLHMFIMLIFFDYYFEGNAFSNFGVITILEITAFTIDFVILAIFEHFAGFTTKTIMPAEYFTSFSKGIVLVSLSFISLATGYAIGYVFRKFFRKHPLPKIVGIVILTLFLGYSLFVGISTGVFEKGIVSFDYGASFLFFVVIIPMLSFIMIAKIIYDNMRKKQLRNENQYLDNQVKLQHEYYEAQDEYRQKIREMRHDIENHIRTIQILIEKGEQEEFKRYSDELFTSYHSNKQIEFCGNKIANAVLHEKSQHAAKLGIDFTADVKIPENIPIKSIDLMCILSNILDNAVKSCERFTGNNPGIKISAVQNAADLIIKCVNSCSDDIKIKNGEIVRLNNKRDNSTGLGLKIIKDTAKKYNGALDCSKSNDKFNCVITLVV